jgi:putative nucleotidyltransferase with HDIG domain
MLTREEAIKLLNKYIKDKKLIKHALIVETIMSNIAHYLNEDENLWSLVGLLYDLDYEYTKDNPEEHSLISAKLLDGLLPEEGINAIKSHNYIYSNYIPSSKLDKSLIAADSITDLIIALVNTIPSKKINEINQDILYNKYNDKLFEKDCNRNKIKLCLDIGIDIKKFLEISLNALIKNSNIIDL